MFLYNITINFNPQHRDWLLPWIKDEIILGIIKSGYFHSSKLFRLLNEVEGTGLTYSMQFFANNQTDIDSFRLHKEVSFLEQLGKKLPGDLVYFVSILEQEEVYIDS